MNVNKVFAATLLLLIFSWGSLKAQRSSLYNDIQAHEVGDIITVVLAENISGASKVRASTNSSTGGGAQSSLSSNILPFEPVFGADVQVTYNADERIVSDQQNFLRGTLSVRIKGITKNGNYLIKGERKTEINGDRLVLTLEGYIRPADISKRNTVLSYRIADAKINYLKKGDLGTSLHKTGIGRKILWGILGVATGVAAYMLGN